MQFISFNCAECYVILGLELFYLFGTVLLAPQLTWLIAPHSQFICPSLSLTLNPTLQPLKALLIIFCIMCFRGREFETLGKHMVDCILD